MNLLLLAFFFLMNYKINLKDGELLHFFNVRCTSDVALEIPLQT